MADVYPRRNLPGEAEEWGRTVETRTDENSNALESLALSVAGQNRSTASSLEAIAAQLTAIQSVQTSILATQQAQAQTLQFLQTQSQFTNRDTIITWTGSMAGSVVWEGFNGTYDCEIGVTTGSSGRILVKPSARLVNVGGTASPILAVEVVGVTGPDFPVGAGNIYLGMSGAVVTSREVQYTLSPNTAYTVRTRRGRLGTGSGLECNWGYQSLGVTRMA